MSFLLGQISEEQFMSSTSEANAKIQNKRRCEANLFAGERHLLRGQAKQAALSFHEAQSVCARASEEYLTSAVELKRLAP